MTETTDQPTMLPQLTPAQADVLARVVDGQPSSQIERELHIAANSRKQHLQAIYAALGMSSRQELIAWFQARVREGYEAQIRALGGTPRRPKVVQIVRRVPNQSMLRNVDRLSQEPARE